MSALLDPVTDSDGPAAETVPHRPPPHLRPLVEMYVGYRMAGFEAGVHRGLPGRHLTVVLPFDEPLAVSWLDAPGEGASCFETLIGGLHQTPALIHHSGCQHGIQLSLTPEGARKLFGLPAGALASVDVPLDELWPGAGELRDRLEASRSWDERFAQLDHSLSELAGSRRVAGMGAELSEAWRLVTGSGGRIAVAEVARVVGWSRRHLSARFTDEFGVGPKAASRIVRFERSRSMLLRHTDCTLADLAAECGYADQSHLSREWGSLAGASPTAWLAGEALPVVPHDDDRAWD